jgi:hypothetical protein
VVGAELPEQRPGLPWPGFGPRSFIFALTHETVALTHETVALTHETVKIVERYAAHAKKKVGSPGFYQLITQL